MDNLAKELQQLACALEAFEGRESAAQLIRQAVAERADLQQQLAEAQDRNSQLSDSLSDAPLGASAVGVREARQLGRICGNCERKYLRMMAQRAALAPLAGGPEL